MESISMRPRTITESSRRITKRPYRSIGAALFVALVGGAAPAATSVRVDHVRGIILGTTITSLDVGTPSRVDIHLEMSPEPYVVIAEPSDASAIVANAFVSVLADAKTARVRCVVIVPDTAHVFASGRTPWDAPGKPSTLESGRVTTRDERRDGVGFAIGVAGAIRRFTVAKNVPIIALRPGSRAALLSPHNVFVFAIPPTSDLTDSIRSVIVADGSLTLPF